MDTAVSRDARLWAAQRTIAQHQHVPDATWQTGRCAQCRTGGCPLLNEAQQALVELTAPSVRSRPGHG